MTKRLCQAMGCGTIVKDKAWCEQHQPARPKDRRKSASQRGYGVVWRRFRRKYLADYPLCEDCKERGRVSPAEEVHHIKKLADGGDKLDEDNCMGLCKVHHTVRTNRGE